MPSAPHVAMTLAVLTAQGLEAAATGARSWRVAPGRPRGGDVVVEPDLSNMLPFAAAALVTRGVVRVAGFPAASPVQPVEGVRALLEALGARLGTAADGGDLVVDGSGGPRPGGELDLSQLGELVPVVAALAALAPGRTTIRGVAHLRGHETDRLAALAAELGGLGADVRETADGLDLGPADLHGGVFATYDDHRLATAAAVVGLAVPGVRVVDVATTGKTLPGFVDLWDAMLSGADPGARAPGAG
jgi:3-phosphoshikimate 1-carboxyvinyltransferase